MPIKHGDCIKEENVPCAKARAYLRKHGRLCPAFKEQPVRKPKKKKSLWAEWFG